ncbi:hypothetical protein ASPVEDRAFT_53136 [Aspergillus versicolor CBS 583.65]|uniref:DUF7730 domain-containing protein n=1 Tax=Aspergillus versicolor CBS 583.65 TaxID=1036611 RepID=A0A1L9PLN8_ASPVE|nr:uncharacterized protein ASPVEDRAFT_53136 [Aspergillus versicolor CBS 583.65]OJJ02449.1 hypothetical protein ASPVEDRAFT_53136 [Aspergillus versicolor CBS 583.65]
MARIKQGVFSWEDVLAHRYQNNKPAALPRPRRQSALSSQSQSQTRQSETNLCWDIQLQSSLLATLSPELRVMVWEQVLGGMRIHIIQRADRRMGHIVCPALEACDICRGGLPPSCCKESRPHIPGSGLLALLLTCKQIYSESIHLLYTLNTFEFSSTWSLTYLHPTIPADLWDSIRVVELSWAFPGHWLPSKDPVKSVYFSAGRQQWIDTCCAVSRMKSLQSFTLHLSGSWFSEPVEKLPVFLEPLRSLHLRQKWQLHLPRQPYYVKEIRNIDSDLKKRGIDCVVQAT